MRPTEFDYKKLKERFNYWGLSFKDAIKQGFSQGVILNGLTTNPSQFLMYSDGENFTVFDYFQEGDTCWVTDEVIEEDVTSFYGIYKNEKKEIDKFLYEIGLI